MTTTATTVTESVTPVTVIVIQSQLLSSSHSYRHNAAIPAARATCGQHKGPNMMMFSPLYQQRSAAASKLRVRNIQPEPVRTSPDQFGPVWNSLRPSETSSLEQSDSNRFRPIQLNPKHPARTSRNQPKLVRTSQDRFGTGLSPSETSSLEQSDSNRFRPIQLSPKHPARTSPEPVRTSQDRLGTACARPKPPVWNNPTQTGSERLA